MVEYKWVATPFIIATILGFMAAVFSGLRGGKYVCKEKEIQKIGKL